MEDILIKQKHDFQKKISQEVNFNVKEYYNKINNIVDQMIKEKKIKFKKK